MEKRLTEHLPVKKILPMRQHLERVQRVPSGVGVVFFVEFEDGLQAVFKPEAENSAADAEVDAYRLMRHLGGRLIPPTVRATVDGKVGSLMLYVESPHDLLASSKKTEVILANVPEDELEEMHVFDFVFGQWDRHRGNLIVDETFSLAMIDNEDIRVPSYLRLGNDPFIRRRKVPGREQTGMDQLKKKPFPVDEVRILHADDLIEVVAFFDRFGLPSTFHKEFSRFKDGTLRYVIWKDKLWIQRPKNSLGPHRLKWISRRRLETYKTLNAEILRQLAPFMTDEHIELALERRDLLVEMAGKSLPIVDR